VYPIIGAPLVDLYIYIYIYIYLQKVNCVKFNEESTMVLSGMIITSVTVVIIVMCCEGSYDATVKAWDLR